MLYTLHDVTPEIAVNPTDVIRELQRFAHHPADSDRWAKAGNPSDVQPEEQETRLMCSRKSRKPV